MKTFQVLAPIVAFLSLNAFAQTDFDLLKSRLSGKIAGSHQGGIFEDDANSLAQFENARKSGINIVEMDLRITKDGVPVIFHDEKLGMWTNCLGFVKDYTLEELKNCRYLNHDREISTYEDILKWSAGRIIVNAEFKDTETIGPALALVAKYKAHSWVYFQVQASQAKYYKTREFDSNVALLFGVFNPEDLNWALSLNDEKLLIIEVNKASFNPDYVNKIKAAGKLVTMDAWNLVWHKETMGAACGKAWAAGIDIAISNQTKKCVSQK